MSCSIYFLLVCIKTYIIYNVKHAVFVFTHIKFSLPLTAFPRNTYIITCLLTYNLLTYELLHEDNHKHMTMSANSSTQLIHNKTKTNKKPTDMKMQMYRQVLFKSKRENNNNENRTKKTPEICPVYHPKTSQRPKNLFAFLCMHFTTAHNLNLIRKEFSREKTTGSSTCTTFMWP